MDTRHPVIHAKDEGDRRDFLGGGVHTWKLTTADTDGAFFLLEDVMARGKCTPLHKHPEADETVYVLEGEILVNIGDQERRVRTGGMTFTPRGLPHAFVVLSARARVLTFQTPGVGEGFYRGASEPATEASAGTIDLARLQASAKENPRGIEILGPPPFEDIATD
jgi:quercetin dioxygenase-like cupin family protein